MTACPTGIAHTYMAADALKAKAKEMNIDFKVETNGSTGVKNALTQEEIDEAVAIIVAADKQVEMARFNGKKVIQVPVAQGIRIPEELLTKPLTRMRQPTMPNKQLSKKQKVEKEVASINT